MRDSRYGAPIILDGPNTGAERVLVEVPLDAPSFREDRLQDLIATHPTVLPIQEIEPAFAPLICLGREVPCKSGYVDILFTSATGYLTLVETKLWDNPESRREVVGQIIDYAKDLSRWSFEDLDQAVRRAMNPPELKGKGLIEIVRCAQPDFPEVSYRDTVSRNLRRGSALLIVAGNGIREGVAEIAEYLQGTPNLHFSLALVELALFQFNRHETWPLLVQPRILTQTVQVVRAVVEVRAAEGLEVKVTLPAETETEEQKPRRTLTEEAFFEQLVAATNVATADGVRELIEDLRRLGLIQKWGAISASLRFPDPLKDREFTVLVINTAGRFYLGWLAELEKSEYDKEIAARYRDGVMNLTGAKPSGTDATKETPVQAILNRKADFLNLVQQLLEELQTAAQNKND